MSSPRRGSLRVGGGGAKVHKPHWASRCIGIFESKDVPFERSLEQDDPVDVEPSIAINPIPLKVDPERLQKVFAFAVSAFTEATARKRDAAEQDPEKRALNLASTFAKRWRLRAAAKVNADAIVEEAQTDVVREGEEEEQVFQEQVQIPSRVSTIDLSPEALGNAREGRAYASEGRTFASEGRMYGSEGRRYTSEGRKCASEEGRSYASEWKSFGITAVAIGDDSDDTGACASNCASSPCSPRSVKSCDWSEKSQRQKRLTRPVEVEEFEQAKPPVPLKISDFPPINSRKSLDQRTQGAISHYDYFDMKSASFPDGLASPQLRRATRQRVISLGVTVGSPCRQSLKCTGLNDLRESSLSPVHSPKSARSVGSFLPRLVPGNSTAN